MHAVFVRICIYMDTLFENMSFGWYLKRAKNAKQLQLWKIPHIRHAMEMHDDVIKWKHFARYWPFVRGIH